MAQLQGIPSSISINHTQKENQNPSTVIYSLKNNNLLKLLNKVNNSSTKSCQSQKTSDHQLLNAKANQPIHAKQILSEIGKIHNDNRVLRFSELQKLNFQDIQYSQSSKQSDEQNNSLNDLKLDERFMSQTTEYKSKEQKKFQFESRNLQQNNWKQFAKEKLQKNCKSSSKNKGQKQKYNQNTDHISLTIQTQPNKFYKKHFKQSISGKSKDKNAKTLLMLQILKNKQLKQKLQQTQKQNTQLRQIIFQMNKKSLNKSNSNTNIFQMNPSIRHKICQSKQKFKGNRSISKQSKQNKKRIKEMKKQISKLQEILTKLRKNVDGVQLRERKMKVSSAAQKSKHRFKTQIKQKTIIQ